MATHNEEHSLHRRDCDVKFDAIEQQIRTLFKVLEGNGRDGLKTRIALLEEKDKTMNEQLVKMTALLETKASEDLKRQDELLKTIRERTFRITLAFLVSALGIGSTLLITAIKLKIL